MGSLERYIFRQAAVAFVAGLFVLTLVVWITQILRQLDLVTNSGQTIVLFIMMTSLGLPFLVMLIAPIALFIAIVQTLSKLNGDSELIVIAAAGVAPRQVIRPFLALTMIVTVLVGLLAIWIAPAAIRHFRTLLTQVQANIVAAIVRPGQFTQAERGLTFHVRDRAAGGLLLGIIVSDARDPTQHLTYLAERGTISDVADGTVMVLENGNMQRRDPKGGEIAIVHFDRYAYNLSQLTQAAETIYRPSERYITELLWPDPSDPNVVRWAGRFRQELHDRFAAPLYAVALMCIAFAMLGHARTTRQSRTLAVAGAIGSMALVRGAGFAVSGLVANQPNAVPLVYLVPVGAIIGYGSVALGFWRPTMPTFIVRAGAAIEERIAKLAEPRVAVRARS